MTSPANEAVAIVTGGSGPAGREIVRELARQGYAVVIVYLDDQSSAEATVEDIFAAGGTSVAVRADLTDELDVERLFAESVAAFGAVDLVVHTTADSARLLQRQAAQQLGRAVAVVNASRVADLAADLESR